MLANKGTELVSSDIKWYHRICAHTQSSHTRIKVAICLAVNGSFRIGQHR